jgi:hypothetical protein
MVQGQGAGLVTDEQPPRKKRLSAAPELDSGQEGNFNELQRKKLWMLLVRKDVPRAHKQHMTVRLPRAPSF